MKFLAIQQHHEGLRIAQYPCWLQVQARVSAGGTTQGGKSKVQEKLNLNIIVTFAIYIFSGIDLNNINHAFVVFYLVCDLSPYIL